MLRVYKADFNQYSNLATKSIYNEKTQEYQSTDNGYLIMFDYDLSKYMEFGGGFKTLTYLGLMSNFK